MPKKLAIGKRKAAIPAKGSATKRELITADPTLASVTARRRTTRRTPPADMSAHDERIVRGKPRG